MPEVYQWTNRQINTDLARAFRQIVTAGWANKSDGNVEAPIGHFALVLISPTELAELMEAVFDRDYPGSITTYPGAYIVCEDSDGNTELIEYLTNQRAEEAYNQMAREYALWDATCPRCGNEGPHGRMVPPRGNTFVCCCGTTWDPTEGI